MFVRRLRDLDAPRGRTFAAALRSGVRPAPRAQRLRVARRQQRAAAEGARRDVRDASVPVRFETAPALVSGIELTAGGQRLAWSIADYLGSLEKGVDELLTGREPGATDARQRRPRRRSRQATETAKRTPVPKAHR